MKASDDGVEMVRRIRESARQQPETVLTANRLNLNEVLQDSVSWTEDYAREAHSERGARIEFEMNLSRNSVDAISGEGRIRIESQSKDKDARNIVTVSDTGEGISGEVMGKLFRPLFTTKGERGTGLGLATCYAIVRRHGGDIEVNSEVGKGTTFTVRLPTEPE
jgi:signal transduction histidine kinase